MADSLKLHVPIPPKSKARPRVTMRGTFMPKDYMDWKKRVRDFIKQSVGLVHFGRGPLSMSLVLYKTSFHLTIESIADDHVYLRGDVDNMAGGIMDAIQAAKGETGLYDNDSQVRELHVRVAGKDE
jgi:Holliday junction resolvase RusA-like endonuclease